MNYPGINQLMLKGEIENRVLSGLSLHTTFGNTLRLIVFIRLICLKS